MNRFFVASCVISLMGMGTAGCKDDEVGGGGLSEQGESCERSADCASGLACFGGSCLPSDLSITPNNRQCTLVQCESAAECCDVAWSASSICDTYEELCAEDPVIYESECQYVTDYCSCSASSFDCINNICMPIDACTDDADCYPDTCVNGRCQECESDADCGMDQTCEGNICVYPECETSFDCPPFYACQGAECVEVGCQTDRECMVYEGSYLAICNKKAKPVASCEIKCSTDAECYESTNPLRSCVKGSCVDPGCETDEECKVLLQNAIGGISGARAVCKGAK